MSNTAVVTPSSFDDDSHDRITSIRGATADPVHDYLEQIGRTLLLSADDEIALAKQIEVGLVAQEHLASDTNIEEATRAEMKLIAREGRAAYVRFVRSNLRLVVSVARRYGGRGALLMDLVQEGNLGLDAAVKRFDHRKGYRFSTYAMWWIRQAITHSLADSAHLIRIPVHTVEKINKLKQLKREITIELGRTPSDSELAKEAGLTRAQMRTLLSIDREPLSLDAPVGGKADLEFGELIVDGDALPVSEVVNSAMRNAAILGLVNGLPLRDAKIVRLRFGLNGKAPMTLDQVATLLDISGERVRQIQTRAFKELRCPQLLSYL